jgi:tRNA pseudouridine55 synthase
MLEAMNGLLVIDKPAGLTSHDVVARVRRILREKRAGHTGTLDPFATGALVVLVGQATRLAQFLHGADKTYTATIRFGFATDTGDLTGTPRPESYARTRDISEITAQDMETALQTLRGPIQQTPPMYSAKKVRGKKLYELARAGQEITRQPVAVKVHQYEATPRNGALFHFNEDGTADLDVAVCCSAGTYVRALAEDLGARLGLGAHLVALRRTQAGAFSLAQAVTLEQLEEQGAASVQPCSVALTDFPRRRLDADETRRVLRGQALPWREAPLTEGQFTQMQDERGELVAVAVYDAASNALRPRVVLARD